jgi:chromosome segregation ATPase
MSEDKALRDRFTRQGEEALGRLAQEILESPLVTGALSAASETRIRAMRVQTAAMGALNLPTASDLERLTRRIRSVSQRLEGIEDTLDRLDERIEKLSRIEALEARLNSIEQAIGRVESAVEDRSPSPTSHEPD